MSRDPYNKRLFLKLSNANVRPILNGYFTIGVVLFLVISIQWTERTTLEVVLYASRP
jgi:hypothetical protein